MNEKKKQGEISEKGLPKEFLSRFMNSRLRYLPALAVSVTILYFSLKKPSPGEPSDILFIPRDKFLHFTAYLCLSITLMFTQRSKRLVDGFKLVSIGVAYGFGIELLQMALNYRTFDIVDAVTNGLGASTILLWYIFHHLSKTE